MTEKLLEDYEEVRQTCLRYGGYSPDSPEVCHQAIQRLRNLPAVVYQALMLLDNMALKIKEDHEKSIINDTKTDEKDVTHEGVAMPIFDEIRQWAHDRNLILGATMQGQMLKMTEEVGELAHGVARNDEAEMRDAIGDCVVVLTILAAQMGIAIECCIEEAYDEIKDRKGKMVDGIFVKEE